MESPLSGSWDHVSPAVNSANQLTTERLGKIYANPRFLRIAVVERALFSV